MARYNSIPVLLSTNEKPMRQTVRYPEIPRADNDIYIFTTIGDRYDTLAQQYYKDSSLWWIIANAQISSTDKLNTEFKSNSLTPPLGAQIRIPNSPTQTLVEFDKLNPPTSFTQNDTDGNGY